MPVNTFHPCRSAAALKSALWWGLGAELPVLLGVCKHVDGSGIVDATRPALRLYLLVGQYRVSCRISREGSANLRGQFRRASGLVDVCDSTLSQGCCIG